MESPEGVPVQLTNPLRLGASYNIVLRASIIDGIDTLMTYITLSASSHCPPRQRVIAQQGSYGNPNYGWHYTKPDGTNADFDTVQQVLDFHGLEYI